MAAEVGAGWRIADTASADFGETVGADILNLPATGVVRGAVGLACVGVPARWVAVEHVADVDLVAWTADKQSGAGRDPRLGSAVVGAGPDSGVGIVDARRGFRPRDLSTVPSWPHMGPRAVIEVVQGVVGLGLTFFTYHEHWLRSAGLHADHGAAHEHGMLCQILGLSTVYDRLDPTNCAGLELAARRLVMIERAVRVNSKSPSFEGLSKMVQHSMDEGGGLATREFTAHMAHVAESEARVLKQNRLLREEMQLKRKDKGKGGDAGPSK